MVGTVACGMRVACWWAGDLQWFTGTLQGYDPVKYEHTVCYDDGDVQQQSLFREMVRIKSGTAKLRAAWRRHTLKLADDRIAAPCSNAPASEPEAVATPGPVPGAERGGSCQDGRKRRRQE